MSKNYAHRYAYLPSDPRYAQAWPAILAGTRTIIERVRRAGIVVAGPDGLRRPVLGPDVGIEFNGDATTDLHGHTLSPRELVAELFEPYPVNSPFTDVGEFVARPR
jgi:hypothetical protein